MALARTDLTPGPIQIGAGVTVGICTVRAVSGVAQTIYLKSLMIHNLDAANTQNVKVHFVPNSSGNVGVGVADPDQKLEVAGAIHMSGEVSSPSAPSDGDGVILYAKSDGKLYFISNEEAETEIGGGGGGGFATSYAAGLLSI